MALFYHMAQSRGNSSINSEVGPSSSDQNSWKIKKWFNSTKSPVRRPDPVFALGARISERSDNESQCSESNSESSSDSESKVSSFVILELHEQIRQLRSTLKLKNKLISDLETQHNDETISLINTLSQLQLKHQDLQIENDSLRKEVASVKQVNLRLDEHCSKLEKQSSKIKESKGKEVDESKVDSRTSTEPSTSKSVLEPRPVALERATPAPPKQPTPPKNASSTRTHTSQRSSSHNHAYMYDRRGSRSYAQQNQYHHTNHATPSFYAPAFHDTRIHQAPDYTFRQPQFNPFLANLLFWQDQLLRMHQNTYYQIPRHYDQSTQSTWTKKTGHKPRVRKVWVRKDSLKSDSNPEGPKV